MCGLACEKRVHVGGSYLISDGEVGSRWFQKSFVDGFGLVLVVLDLFWAPGGRWKTTLVWFSGCGCCWWFLLRGMQEDKGFVARVRVSRESPGKQVRVGKMEWCSACIRAGRALHM